MSAAHVLNGKTILSLPALRALNICTHRIEFTRKLPLLLAELGAFIRFLLPLPATQIQTFMVR